MRARVRKTQPFIFVGCFIFIVVCLFYHFYCNVSAKTFFFLRICCMKANGTLYLTGKRIVLITVDVSWLWILLLKLFSE
jgi:hypothetical protein